MTTQTLTFGSTFTLPLTGDAEWKTRDTRPIFAHLAGQHQTDATAYAKCETTGQGALYTPATGWRAIGEKDGGRIVAELSALDFHLPAKTAEDYTREYTRMLVRETRNEVTGITEMVTAWTDGTDIDPAPLRAHVAAVAALTAIGQTPEGNPDLYQAIYQLAIAEVTA